MKKLKVDNIEYGMLVNGLVELRNKLLKEKEDTSPIDELLSCRLELVMKNVIYILIQCTWGLPQTLLGFIVLLINKINIIFITVQLLLKEMFLQVYLWECSSLQQLIR